MSAPSSAGLSAHREVVEFWFDETDPARWWTVDPAFDKTIRSRFLATWQRAAQGELFEWRASPHGRLAEVIVLDQFSRNLFRTSATAFAQDAMALALAQEAVVAGSLPQLQPVERAFLLLPYMHSESRRIHEWADALYREWAPADNHEFELRHKAIVDRFGRYPHRNATLGRASTPEEIEFLKQPGSAF